MVQLTEDDLKDLHLLLDAHRELAAKLEEVEREFAEAEKSFLKYKQKYEKIIEEEIEFQQYLEKKYGHKITPTEFIEIINASKN